MTLPVGTQQQTQHFLLKWNNHRSNMVSIFENLLHSENLVDVTIAVEGKFLKAHKIVLSACSPYFQAMFVQQTPEKHPILIFHDMKYCHIKTLLDFMYRGEISIDERELSDILKVAEALSIRGLSSFESDDEENENNNSQTNGNEDSSSSTPSSQNVNGSEARSENTRCSSPVSSPKQSFDNHEQKVLSEPASRSYEDNHSSRQVNKEASPSIPMNSKSKEPPEPKVKHKKDKKSSTKQDHSDHNMLPIAKKSKVSSKLDVRGGLHGKDPELKKKRGRQSKNKLLENTMQNMKAAAAKAVQGIPTEMKAPLPPRQGVRRRLPRRFPGAPKRGKLNSSSSIKLEGGFGHNTSDGSSHGDGSPLGTMDGALPPEFTNSEPLSEMSVRGLDLFKYASVEDGVYRCIECEKLQIPKTFKNKYSFQRHAFLYHEGNMRKVFPCPICSREFSRPDKMKNHLKSFHNSRESSTPVNSGNGNGSSSSNSSSGGAMSTNADSRISPGNSPIDDNALSWCESSSPVDSPREPILDDMEKNHVHRLVQNGGSCSAASNRCDGYIS